MLYGSVLFGADDLVASMVQTRIHEMPQGGFGDYTALGVVRDDVLIGGVVYHAFRPRDRDIQVSIAFDRADWALPSTLRTLFSYPFQQLGCIRITAIVSRQNKHCRRFTAGLGFKLEGVMRKAINGQDAFLFGMLKEECRFIRKVMPDGQAVDSRRSHAA